MVTQIRRTQDILTKAARSNNGNQIGSKRSRIKNKARKVTRKKKMSIIQIKNRNIS
jgi:hypothetical protein